MGVNIKAVAESLAQAQKVLEAISDNGGKLSGDAELSFTSAVGVRFGGLDMTNRQQGVMCQTVQFLNNDGGILATLTFEPSAEAAAA